MSVKLYVPCNPQVSQEQNPPLATHTPMKWLLLWYSRPPDVPWARQNIPPALSMWWEMELTLANLSIAFGSGSSLDEHPNSLNED